MPNKEPRKPANPHGYFNFSKNGPVEKRMFAQDCDRCRTIPSAATGEAE